MKHQTRLVLLEICGTALVIAVWWWRRPKTIEQVALEAMEALLSGDVATLRDLQMPHEKKLCGYTPENTEWLVKSKLLPRIQKFEQISKVQVQTSANGAQATAFVALRNKYGKQAELNFPVMATQDGAKACLSYAILSSWLLENMFSDNAEDTVRLAFLARAKGATDDATQMDAYGIKGLTSFQRLDSYSNWKDVSAFYTRGAVSAPDKAQGQVFVGVESLPAK